MMILGTVLVVASSISFSYKARQEFNKMQHDLQSTDPAVPAVVELQEGVDMAAVV